MRLDRLEIRGFFHFAEPAVLNMDDLPHGLIALVGPNGNGKTRLLDAPMACLYGPDGGPGAFPSREGRIAQYATSKDAYIKTQWTLEGAGTYLARVNVDGEKRATDAVLQEVLADGRSVPVNDGKSTTFRTAIDSVFPSKRSMLCSAVASQNKAGSFVELGQKERLELFAELADLGHYAQKAATAKQCGDIASGVALQVETSLAVLETQTSDAALLDIEQRLASLDADLEAYVEKRAGCAAVLAQLEQEHQSLQEQATAHAVAETEAAGLHTRIEKLDSDLTVQFERIKKATSDHEAFVKGQDFKIAANQKLLGMAADIRKAAVLRKQLTAKRDELSAAWTRGYDKVSELAQVDKELMKQLGEVRNAEARLEKLRWDAQTLDEVPFGAKCAEAKCQFVENAAQAKALIPQCEAIVEAGVKIRDKDHENTDAQGKLTAAQNALKAETAAIDAKLKADTLSQYEPELALVEQRVAQYELDKVQAGHRLRDTLVECNAACRQVEMERDEADERLQECSRVMQVLDAARQQLERVRSQLPVVRSDMTRLDTALALRDAEKEQRLLERDAFHAKRAVVETVRERHQAVSVEAMAWQSLAKACGRDGLPKLEIDAAGPTVSSYCNELLAGAFGTRFTLDVVTQVPTADGKGMKETFTIQVLDNDHGAEPRDIADLSGGERVIVEEALRAALACYVNTRNRQPVRTLFRDETTGALDPDNAPRYIAMLRSLVRLSGAVHCLFVTHSPECAALADAQVHVCLGVPTVILPPYAEVA